MAWCSVKNIAQEQLYFEWYNSMGMSLQEYREKGQSSSLLTGATARSVHCMTCLNVTK